MDQGAQGLSGLGGYQRRNKSGSVKLGGPQSSRFACWNSMLGPSFLVVAIFAICAFPCGVSARIGGKPGGKQKSIVPDNYAQDSSPSEDGSTLIEFAVHVINSHLLKSSGMELRLDMLLQQSWIEQRFRVPDDYFDPEDEYSVLPTEVTDRLWLPDPYITNMKTAETVDIPQKLSNMVLYRNKTVQYTLRMSVMVGCPVQYNHYPFDMFECNLIIESFSYNEKYIKLAWKEDPVTTEDDPNPTQFQVMPIEHSTEVVKRSGSDGNFSRLTLRFGFRRNFPGGQMLRTLLPSALVVVSSWAGFWIGLDVVTGRVFLIVTCFLSILILAISDSDPNVQIMDMWLSGCMVFVALALLELVIVKALEDRLKVARSEWDQGTSGLYPVIRGQDTILPRSTTPYPLRKPGYRPLPPPQGDVLLAWGPDVLQHRGRAQGWLALAWLDPQTGKEKLLWKELDHKSRLIFPILFVIYAVVFWPLVVLHGGKGS